METPPMTERRHVHYSGNVQGVGFRYTARSIATGHDVTGYVKNLRDGRVELIVEGARIEIASLLREIQTELGRHIREVHETSMPATGEFTQFEVRY